MNIHKNAKTCPRSRALMVSRVLEEKRPVAEVATAMGVSRNTVYKWVRRYCAGGAAALEDGSSAPRDVPHRLGEDWVKLIVEMRVEYRMTALRRREGLSQLGKLEPVEPAKRYEHAAPGEMLQLDIKQLGRFWRAGHRVTGRRREDSEGAGWEYVHVCVDDYTRARSLKSPTSSSGTARRRIWYLCTLRARYSGLDHLRRTFPFVTSPVSDPAGDGGMNSSTFTYARVATIATIAVEIAVNPDKIIFTVFCSKVANPFFRCATALSPRCSRSTPFRPDAASFGSANPPRSREVRPCSHPRANTRL